MLIKYIKVNQAIVKSILKYMNKSYTYTYTHAYIEWKIITILKIALSIEEKDLK